MAGSILLLLLCAGCVNPVQSNVAQAGNAGGDHDPLEIRSESIGFVIGPLRDRSAPVSQPVLLGRNLQIDRAALAATAKAKDGPRYGTH
jgi:hypothetical protein